MSIDLDDRATQYRTNGNPDLLRQVFMNMFDNAIKYGAPGTAVSISPRVQSKTNMLLITIKSEGMTIPYAELESIFTLGFRSAVAKTRVASGTGLGLHICRTIIREVHGGNITAESSEYRKTTTFFIRLPRWSIDNGR